MPYRDKEASAKYMRDYRALRKPWRKPSEANVNPCVNPCVNPVNPERDYVNPGVNPVGDSSASISDTVNPVYFKYGGRDLGEIYDTRKEEFHRDIEKQATRRHG